MNFGSDSAILPNNSPHFNPHTNRLAVKKRRFEKQVAKRGFKRTFREANELLSRFRQRIRGRYTVVKSLFKKLKYSHRRKGTKRKRDPGPENYIPSKVGAVFALRCIDENCGY